MTIDVEKAAKPRPDLLPLAFFVDSDELWMVMRGLLDAVTQPVAAPYIYDAAERLATVIGPHAWLRAGEVMGYGVRKHGRTTWRVVGTAQAEPQTHLASAIRHLLEWRADHDAVEEGSGLPVLWHALAQLAICWDLLQHPPTGTPGVHDGRGVL